MSAMCALSIPCIRASVRVSPEPALRDFAAGLVTKCFFFLFFFFVCSLIHTLEISKKEI